MFTNDNCYQQKSLFDLYLKNSNNHPLSIAISFFWNANFVYSMPEEIIYTLERMEDGGHRLKFLYMDLTYDDECEFYNAFDQLSRSYLPLLEKVKLRRFDTDRRFLYLTIDDVFCNSPQLRVMGLSGINYQINVSAACTQITTLRLDVMSGKNCLDAIYFFPNLTELAFVLHSSLVSLKFVYINPIILSVIFNSTLCPALRKLHLNSETPHRDTPPEINLLKILGESVKGSGCQLDTLVLKTDELNDDLWPVLDCFNDSIEKLELKQGYRFDVFPAFMQKFSSAIFLPQLKEFKFCTVEGPYDYCAVLQALHTRMGYSMAYGEMARLVLFEAIAEWTDHIVVDRTVVDGFDDLKQHGMDVLFKVKRGGSPFLTVQLIPGELSRYIQ
ncbi:hypothetical protein BDQ17DRAFT_1433951 [Cyathus striatus]|nr:hypothetical protein BDQ17DRAFT_1433951 [Cyathus striatus]